MARNHNTSAGNLTAVTNEKCQLCYDRDPQVRSKHHLFLAKEQSLDYVKAHLEDSYGHKTSAEGQDGMDTVNSIVAWLANLKSIYGGTPNEKTGAAMPWFEMRQRMIETRDHIAEDAYQKAVKEGRVKPIELQDVSALQHLMSQERKEN